ncbi:MAG: PSD1 and planctomycete cytochrome C domain-containing protein [Pirellulales bacterium]
MSRKCHGCHGANRQEGGLRLDFEAAARQGGDSGAAILPGNSRESRMVRLVSGLEEGLVMPPEGDGLSGSEIELLAAWIDQGAQWSEDAGGPARAAADHWSFRPIRRPSPPAVTREGWVRNSIDAFVLARLEPAGVPPAAEADRYTLIRRLSLDLHGLLPSPADVEAFAADTHSDAYERLADRLLASPHFGERWGRHWLDLARYADSNGYDNDEPRPNAWRYRDWVIDAFNRDMPFDRFTLEQLAGDLLPAATFEQQLATGFHRNTPTNTEGGVDREEFRVKTVVDRLNTTGTVWLGLTVGCAECHSHKYDPLSQREYYGLLTFFNSADEATIEGPDGAKAEVLSRSPAQRATRIHLRGDFLNPGDEVRPHTPAVLHSFSPFPLPSDRRQLARWLTAPENPLTARVAANRIWQHLFGRGMVATVDDFGTQGQPPTHPELLDWLASELVDRRWSQKQLIKLIVMSATYRQASTADPDTAARDPENLLLARQNPWRVEAEIVRDLALGASGLLNPRVGGPSFYPVLAEGADKDPRWPASPAAEQHRRGMYIFTQRTTPYPMLVQFDAPDSHVACTRRDRSNTPLQALTLLNDPVFFESAQALAERVWSECAGDIRARIDHAFRLCLARPPNQQESDRLAALLVEQAELFQAEGEGAQALAGGRTSDGASLAEAAAWVGLCRTLLNLDEFVTRR